MDQSYAHINSQAFEYKVCSSRSHLIQKKKITTIIAITYQVSTKHQVLSKTHVILDNCTVILILWL